MSVDWASLALVTVVTVLATAFILTIIAAAARMLDEVHLKRLAGEVKGLHAAELAAGFFLTVAIGILLFGLWLIIPYSHH
ncbi:hypothetical protein [Actinomyces sp. oral taxon 448]|uniref:hypothetical protein n=2 Tax=Actinomyces sp. oral taxon 448 TaxID=712124 RepID=UPI0002189F53|nr:hypothetical protein [Actinomyces sp. oral taxon 448]EGQ73619.1 hypothetical protein HMPREF9062_1616 [Actinomyces sp. oral taxon 448 str. F0400]